MPASVIPSKGRTNPLVQRSMRPGVRQGRAPTDLSGKAGFLGGRLPVGAKVGKSPKGSGITAGNTNVAAPVDQSQPDPNAGLGGGGGGGNGIDVAALQAQLQGYYDAGKTAIGAANSQLLQRFSDMQALQQKSLDQTRNTMGLDLASTQQTPGLNPRDQALLSEQGNRQQSLIDSLGAVQNRSFADRQSNAALLNTGALGNLEQNRLGALAAIAKAAASGNGSGGGSGLSSSDVTDLANAQQPIDNPFAPAVAEYSGPKTGLLKSLSGRLSFDPSTGQSNLGQAVADAIKANQSARTRRGHSNTNYTTFLKTVVNPMKKNLGAARRQLRSQNLANTRLNIKGY